MATFAAQPFGPGLFLRDAAFLVAYLERPNFASRALPRAKTGSGADAMKREQTLAGTMRGIPPALPEVVMQPFAIAPSILSANFARLGEEVDNVLAAGADIVHFDVMDNHYVPNLTIGPMVCSALRKHGVTAPIDVHLMVKPVDRMIGDFLEAGASYITFHPEASEHIDRSLQLIKDGGAKAGLVFNPATPLDVLKYVMDKIDMVLLMSVNPGFGGQKFIPGTLDKLREARALIDASGREIRLEIDGGVNPQNIREIAAAGADTFVAGSAIFNQPDYKAVIDQMRAELALARS